MRENRQQTKAKSAKNERIAFLDYLRAIACFMVMAVHACEPFYLGGAAPNVTSIASHGDALWVIVTESLCRVCVPLFAMASSYLLFPVRRPTGEFFRRRIVRVFVPFAIWAVAYVALAGGDLRQLLFNFPDEGGHLWFVPMLAGVYLAMPLLSPWAEKVGRVELMGWILLWLLTTTFPFLRQLWGLLFGAPPFGAVPYLWGECPWNAFGAFHYVSGFVGYLMVGLWFRKFAPEMGWKRTLALAAPLWLAGVAIMALPLHLAMTQQGFPLSAPYSCAVLMERSIEYNSLGVAFATFAVFLALRRIDFRGAFYRFAIRPIAEASYGMYLMHMLLLPVLFARVHAHLNTPLTILATAAATYALAAILAIAVRKIPKIGKLLS